MQCSWDFERASIKPDCEALSSCIVSFDDTMYFLYRASTDFFLVLVENETFASAFAPHVITLLVLCAIRVC